MSHLFDITISTAFGSTSWQRRANSMQQIADVIPDKVNHYEAVLVPLSSGEAMVDDAELWQDLVQAVSNIEYASEMTPERVQEEHDKQKRALAGLSVDIKQ